MIKEKDVMVKINSKNFKYYIKYGVYKKGDVIKISIEDLSKGSSTKITAICNICGSENIVKYQNYINQKEKHNFYCCRNCGQKKIIITNNEKYNCDFSLQNKEIRKKSNDTLLKKYGITNISQRSDIREKRRERLKNPEYQEKLLNGVIKKFNIDNVSKLEFIKELKKETTNKNHGVDNPTQNYDIFIKSQKSGKNIKKHLCGLEYRGTYEKDFLDFCFENKIILQKGKTIRYKINDKIHYYHSDFFYEPMNIILEIKSSYYYEKYLELNLIKMNETISQGYSFLFLINKNYDRFKEMIF